MTIKMYYIYLLDCPYEVVQVIVARYCEIEGNQAPVVCRVILVLSQTMEIDNIQGL